MSHSSEPPSVGGTNAGTESNPASDPTLLRLHTALKELDGAIHDALRALDVALGRTPTAPPDDALPFRELGRLKMHLEAATAPAQEPQDRNLAGMALDWSEDSEDAGKTEADDEPLVAEGQAG